MFCGAFSSLDRFGTQRPSQGIVNRVFTMLGRLSGFAQIAALQNIFFPLHPLPPPRASRPNTVIRLWMGNEWRLPRQMAIFAKVLAVLGPIFARGGRTLGRGTQS